MSWSINFCGTPKALTSELEKHLETITDPQSRAEYREAIYILIPLVNMNFGIEGKEYRLVANGSGKGLTERQCSVTMTEWDKLV